MRLEDRHHPRGAGLGGGDRRPELVRVVRVVVHHPDAGRGRADDLEPARHAREASEPRGDRARLEAELDGDDGGRRRVLEVVQARLRHVEREGGLAVRQDPTRPRGADAQHLQRRVGVGGHAVGERLELPRQRRRLGAARVGEQAAAVGREARELQAQRRQLGMIAADVVHDADGRAVADQRAVGLAGLHHDRPVDGPGQEAAAGAAVGQRGAPDHRGGEAALAQQPGDHPDERALAAGAGHRDARAPGVDDLGQQRGARNGLDAERARCPHLGGIGLDCAGVDEAVDGRGDGASVLGRQLDPELAQARGDLAALALVQRAVGALDGVAAGAHELGQRVHAGPGDAREVIAKGPRAGGHGAAQCSRNARFRSTRAHDLPRVYRRPPAPAKAFLSRRRLTLSND